MLKTLASGKVAYDEIGANVPVPFGVDATSWPAILDALVRRYVVRPYRDTCHAAKWGVEMNPWKQTILGACRDILRFALWFGVVLNGLMLAVFSIVFVFQFLRHLWSWCDRVMFTGSW